MPKAKRDSAIYQRGKPERGEFVCWLDWDRKANGSLRSPFLAVFWYDPERRRTRSVSTGTSELEAGQRWLDAYYLQQTTGREVCPTCGQFRHGASGYLVTAAIAAYQLDHGDGQTSSKAIKARLAHVLGYIANTTRIDVTCEQIDEKWITRFRSWAEKQRVVGPNGKERDRSLSTIEGSVAQLQAAINHAWRRGDTRSAAKFKPIPTRELNRTPQHRSGVAEFAAMFRYCVEPTVSKKEIVGWGRRKEAYTADEVAAIRRRERGALHRFLILSIATLGRPDAVLDVSTKAERRQWNSNARILALNPDKRRQTKKYRAIVPIAWQVAHHLDAAPKGFFVGPKSVRKAWEAMAAEIGLPGGGEAGMKLIRRSVADLLRQRLPVEAWGEIEIFLGHAKFDQVSDLYAPFRPDYLRRALAVIEGLIDEIEQAVPGAFHRRCTGEEAAIIPLSGLVTA